MSRIGKLPIAVPAGVSVDIAGDNTVTVKGPKGELTRKLHRDMKIEHEGAVLKVTRPTDDKAHRALHGLTRALLNNMVVGVTQGFQKSLELVGTGYRASVSGKDLVIEAGYSHPVKIAAEKGITFECPAPNKIVVKGMEKDTVGQIAANIRGVREPEPYLGKGIKYENERIIRKEGKSGKK